MQKLDRQLFIIFYDTTVLEGMWKYKYQCVYLQKCILKLTEGFLLCFFCCVRPLHLSYCSLILLDGKPVFMAWGTFRGFFLFGMHHTWNTAVYQIFVLISLRNICFAFQICSLNICSSFSPYYFISVMAYNKNIHPHGIIHNKIKVKLIDSGCLNHGNLEWKDLKIFNQHLKCLYSVCSCLYWAVCSVIWK